MARNRQKRNNKRLWGLVSSMGWRRMPCCVLARKRDNIKRTRHHHLLTSEKQGIIFELTVPAEEDLAQANFRKKNWRKEIDPGRTKCRMEAEIFPCWGRVNRIYDKHPPYLLQVLRLNKQRNQKGTGLGYKNSLQSYLYTVACKKHQAIWKLGVGEPPIHPTQPTHPTQLKMSNLLHPK